MKKISNYGILSIIIILAMIVSQSATAMTIKVEDNEKEQANLSTSSMLTVELGTIYCEQSGGTCYVTLDLCSYKQITLSNKGDAVKFTVKYVFKLPGSADDAQAQISYYNDENQRTIVNDYHSGENAEGTLELERAFYADKSFKIKVYGYCSDWWGAVSKSENEDVSIEVIIKSSQPKLSGDGEIKGTNLKPMTPTAVGNDVLIWNSGAPGSIVNWGYSRDNLYGDWDTYPDSNWLSVQPGSGSLTPEDGKQSIEIWITLPKGTTYVKGSLTFYNKNNPSDYVNINMDVHKKAKTTTTSFQLLDNFLDIFNLLRELRR